MKVINFDIPKAEWPTAKCPKKCKYLDTHQICSYYIDTGIRRPCPAGAGCTVADTGKKNRPFERRIVGADGTLVPKSRKASWDTQEARRLREQGMSYRDIAARMGVSKNAVVMYANRCWPDLVTKHKRPWEERAEQEREQRREAASMVLDRLAEGPYRGWLMVECPKCGEIDGYNAKQPTYSIHCRTCGETIPLERLRPLHINCRCGARWTYLTNVRAPEWRVRCIRCKGVNVARMGRRGTAYVAWPEELA